MNLVGFDNDIYVISFKIFEDDDIVDLIVKFVKI